MFYYVYILQSSKNQSLYVGYTSDLRKRFKQHNAGFNAKIAKSGKLERKNGDRDATFFAVPYMENGATFFSYAISFALYDVSAIQNVARVAIN